MMDILFKEEVDVNADAYIGMTPLHLVSREGHEIAIRALLKKIKIK